LPHPPPPPADVFFLPNIWALSYPDISLEVRRALYHALAPSTMAGYNRLIKRFCIFACERSAPFFPASPALFMDFIEVITRSSKVHRPSETIKHARAAVKAMYRGSQHICPTDGKIQDSLVATVTKALVRSRTTRPMKVTDVLDIDKIGSYFVSLGDNAAMELWQLELKTMGLTGLTFLGRPSDLANPFCSGVLVAHDLSRAQINLLGNKADNFEGQQIPLVGSSSAAYCAVQALDCYMQRTLHMRGIHPNTTRLFIDLTTYKPLSSTQIAERLSSLRELAGTPGPARGFRRTGATRGVEIADPRTVQGLGRWASAACFWRHYVAFSLPQDYANKFWGLE
jgi:hypothetical protein